MTRLINDLRTQFRVVHGGMRYSYMYVCAYIPIRDLREQLHRQTVAGADLLLIHTS